MFTKLCIVLNPQIFHYGDGNMDSSRRLTSCSAADQFGSQMTVTVTMTASFLGPSFRRSDRWARGGPGDDPVQMTVNVILMTGLPSHQGY